MPEAPSVRDRWKCDLCGVCEDVFWSICFPNAAWPPCSLFVAEVHHDTAAGSHCDMPQEANVEEG